MTAIRPSKSDVTCGGGGAVSDRDEEELDCDDDEELNCDLEEELDCDDDDDETIILVLGVLLELGAAAAGGG